MRDLSALSATRLRPPAQVMRVDRLGALHQCRLSFARQLTRRMAAERWRFHYTDWSIDPQGCGHAVLAVETGARSYALVAVADTAGATFALCDGPPTPDDIARLARVLQGPVPGRVGEREICLCRAMREETLWNHGDDLATARIAGAPGLMRAGPVRGSGKFGTADRELIVDRPELHGPFQAEMLTLYLIRCFSRDLWGHVTGARLTPAAAAAALGVELTAGLGLAIFPVAHPCLFNTWIMAREEAIARIAALTTAGASEWSEVHDLLGRMASELAAGTSADQTQIARNAALCADLRRLADKMAAGPAGTMPWAALSGWAAATLGPEAQEALAGLMMEPHGDLVDGLGHCMSDTLDRDYRIDGNLSVSRMRALIAATYGWALTLDWAEAGKVAQAWSRIAQDAAPRLDPRIAAETGALDLPLTAGREAARAWQTLGHYPDETAIATVLLDHPEHRSAIRRAQIAGFAPYAEIRDNLVAGDIRPADLMRVTLAFVGATGFDPQGDGGMRARIFAGAPYPDALRPETADRWVYGGAAP